MASKPQQSSCLYSTEDRSYRYTYSHARSLMWVLGNPTSDPHAPKHALTPGPSPQLLFVFETGSRVVRAGLALYKADGFELLTLLLQLPSARMTAASSGLTSVILNRLLWLGEGTCICKSVFRHLRQEESELVCPYLKGLNKSLGDSRPAAKCCGAHLQERKFVSKKKNKKTGERLAV